MLKSQTKSAFHSCSHVKDMPFKQGYSDLVEIKSATTKLSEKLLTFLWGRCWKQGQNLIFCNSWTKLSSRRCNEEGFCVHFHCALSKLQILLIFHH